MTQWPTVLSEMDTLDLVLSGRSLARYGDGELHLCDGVPAKAQEADPALRGRLRGILRSSGHCLVGLPNLRAQTPKAAFWQPFARHVGLLKEREYASAFVTRPDSAPWIDTPTYWGTLAQLWLGQDVLLVRGGARSFTAGDLCGAARVTEVVGPAVNAWRSYRDLFTQVMAHRPTRALLCLGPTATVMAVDLCAHGVQAIDLGHLGLFWKKHLKGEPMIVTERDKAVA
jgi:hypothetical protein